MKTPTLSLTATAKTEVLSRMAKLEGSSKAVLVMFSAIISEDEKGNEKEVQPAQWRVEVISNVSDPTAIIHIDGIPFLDLALEDKRLAGALIDFVDNRFSVKERAI